METFATNSIEDALVIELESIGVPARGFGVGALIEALADFGPNGMSFKADSTTIRLRDVGRIAFVYENPIEAKALTYASIWLIEDGMLQEVARINTSGEIRTVHGKYKLVRTG